MRPSQDLFIGITSWNSAPFLGHCIDAIKRTTSNLRPRVVVLDNESTDGSAELARRMGVEVISRRCNQAQALNHLFRVSRSEFTLLIHSDIIMLSEKWFELCVSHLTGNVALISPEDIGCGPYTRSWGGGMPESSFMLFRTALARSARQWFSVQRFKIRWPYRALDFFGEHVTYNLPIALKKRDLEFKLMKVHPSTAEVDPIYTPSFQPTHWDPSWALYRYGLGNFYSLDGQVTHYHNWYDRTAAESLNIDRASQEMHPREGGMPLAYVGAYTRQFLTDLDNACVVVPDVEHEVDSLTYEVAR